MNAIPRLLPLLLLILVLPFAACAGADEDGVDEPMIEAPAPAEPTPMESAENTVEVGLSEYEIAMPASVPAGPTTFTITNNGTEAHSFEIEGQGIEQELAAELPPGGTAALDVTLDPGTYRVYCPVEDHASEHGMERQLEVTAAGASSAGM